MKSSIFSIAAWYCLVVSLTVVAVTFSIAAASGHMNILPPPSRNFSGHLYGSAFWIEVSSFLLGILSLFGIGRHGAAFILWKAVPGLIASGLSGFVFFALTMMSSIIC